MSQLSTDWKGRSNNRDEAAAIGLVYGRSTFSSQISISRSHPNRMLSYFRRRIALVGPEHALLRRSCIGPMRLAELWGI